MNRPSNTLGRRSARTLAAAAATGAAAAADPPPAPRPVPARERKFRLLADETIPDGIRRVARARLDHAAAALDGVADADLGSAVHAARKDVKRVRAALRLSRAAIADDVYDRENAQLKMAAGGLSAARDARVLTETLAALEERFADELAPHATAKLRARLDDEHRRAVGAMDGEQAPRRAVLALREARARTARWDFDGGDFAAIEPSLRRIYRRGRKRLRAARADPSAETLHECRKRVKDLWHASQLLRGADPKRMKRLSRDAHELADLLGDHHDLSVLHGYIETHPHLIEQMSERDAVLGVLDRRRDVLATRALKLGAKVYERKPRTFTKRVARGWAKRVGAGARPAAG